MDLARLTDDDLLARTPARPEAFGEFYARHESAILGFMLRRTNEPELAADLTAEVFAAALVSVRRYRPGSAPAAAWLYGIARNVLLRSIKRRRVEDRARRRLAMDPLPLTDELLDRPALVAAAAAAAAIAAIVLMPGTEPRDERSAPGGVPSEQAAEYAVLRRPATEADALPSVRHFRRYWLLREDRRRFDPSQTRLAARVGPWSVYLVPAPMAGRPSLCTVIVERGGPSLGGCTVVGQPPKQMGEGGVIVYHLRPASEARGLAFTVRDGIDALTLRVGDRWVRVPVRDNVAVYTYDVGEAAPVRAVWTRAGRRHSRKLAPPPLPGVRRP